MRSFAIAFFVGVCYNAMSITVEAVIGETDFRLLVAAEEYYLEIRLKI